jgi:hypothetical protein
MDRHGQVRLVAVSLAQMPVQPVEAALIGRKIPGRARFGDEGRILLPLPGRRQRVIFAGRSIEDAEADERRLAIFGRERRELLLEEVSGLVGEEAGEPLARAMRLVEARKCREEAVGVMGDDDLRRRGKDRAFAARVVAEENIAAGPRPAMRRASSWECRRALPVRR